MTYYIRKIEDHHGFWDITLICTEKPINVEDYQIVEVENIRDIV